MQELHQKIDNHTRSGLNRIGHQTRSTMLGNEWWVPTVGPGFRSGDPKDWWYFNRHKLLHAHATYGSNWFSAGPIAVIEEHFNLPALKGVNFARDKACLVTKDGNILPWTDDELWTEPLHGNLVSYLIGGISRVEEGLCGFAPGATIVPIKVASGEQSIASAIDHVTTNKLATVINISKVLNIDGKDYPMSVGWIVSRAIRRATAAGISVVCSAGNTATNFDADPKVNFHREGEIVVGGIQPDGYEWCDKIHGMTGFGTPVDIAASSTMNVFGYAMNGPKMQKSDGVSFAVPLVSATVAMMRHINGTLTDPKIIRELLIHSASVGPSNPDNPSGLKPRPDIFLGGCLQIKAEEHKNYYFENVGKKARIRILDVYNALTIAKHAGYRLWRVFNVDDTTKTWIDNDENSPLAVNELQTDSIYLIDDKLTTPRTIWAMTNNTYNHRSSGYQVYWRGEVVYEALDGTVRMESADIYGNHPQVLYETLGSEKIPTPGWASRGGFTL